jgi:hypothetical protein
MIDSFIYTKYWRKIMKRILLATVAVMALSACTTKLAPEDRAMLGEIRNTAEEAKQNSAQALAEAKRARESADQAAKDAAAAGNKADSIFKEAQKK